ncbi:unnamed protein product [Rotaria magnacalcarata]|uniref:E3 ubiquitin-protein ligase MARCHF5 n=8 Tax=Rotaria magnacalcarata TaxID=392030 RepID=A0A816W0B6_9BILA|nr:unnamed protein product [Rotaria magnacalcarata]CAF1572161.1 unnamed protein product [Rotaria magnacalcarata]CAF1990645.1 unnamed protein product [Rotaria magnacalcarata]CAF2127376.1 unnamed protein product [Rotaria magnacalcarata]CAF2255008.1 unnamed protein product [Rotaria magnacalcarata]
MDDSNSSSPFVSNQPANISIVPRTDSSISAPTSPPPLPSSTPSNFNRTSLTNTIQTRNSIPGKHCWVCFATDEDDFSACWVSPCRCRGTAKWVHQECLQRWVDEKQQGSSGVKVACPQCNTEYLIVYSKQGPLVYTLDLIERILNRFCPFLAGGILVGSVYWTAVTYGAVTIMQILGHKEGLSVMEKADPLFLLIGLPTIPIVLILGRMIRWEEAVLKFWRKHSSKLPLMNYLFPSERTSYLPRVPTERNGNSNPASLTRLICGGLILPTIATIFGKFMFQRVHSNFQRTLLGGIAFIVLKGTAKIYYKQSQYIREAHREILNYETTAAASSSHYQHHLPPPPPPAPPVTTVEVHAYDNANEIFVVPSPSSTTNGQSPLNF